MEFGAITSHIDVAQVVLYAFWLFFLGLILYLRYEDQREGYPLENEEGPTNKQAFYPPPPKSYLMRDGSTKESNGPDRPDLDYQKTGYFIGNPILPKGDPMQAGVGPGSYAARADVADVTFDGHDRIVPTRVAPDFGVDPGDDDPRGFGVVTAEQVIVGKIVDLWVDRAEFIIRYFEVELATEGDAPGKHVLVPTLFANVMERRRLVQVTSIIAEQFADIPMPKNADRITRLEEERVVAYFGGGFLYSTPARSESWV